MNAARPYAEELTRALAALGEDAVAQAPDADRRGQPAPRRRSCVITSDRGLAGGYNANAIKRANELAGRLRRRGQGGRALRHRPQGRRRTTTSGSIAAGRIVDRVLRAADLPRRPRRHRGRGRRAAGDVARARRDGEPGIDELYVVYTQFVNSVTQTPTAAQVSPVKAHRATRTPAARATSRRGRRTSDGSGAGRTSSSRSRSELHRRAAAALHQRPDLLRAAGVGGVGVGRPAAGDEVGQRQRRPT